MILEEMAVSVMPPNEENGIIGQKSSHQGSHGTLTGLRQQFLSSTP
jgi:hypothetical protein